jgi:hypothetical protein
MAALVEHESLCKLVVRVGRETRTYSDPAFAVALSAEVGSISTDIRSRRDLGCDIPHD